MREIRSIGISVVALGMLAGPALVVAAQDSAAPAQPPTEFTGTVVCGPEVRAANTDRWTVPLADGEMTRFRSDGYAEQQDATLNEPRLEGSHYLSVDSNDYVVEGEEAGVSVVSLTRRIESEEGAWQGSSTSALLSDGTDLTFVMILAGEGAYEGLMAIWEERFDAATCSSEVRGILLEGDVPTAARAFVDE